MNGKMFESEYEEAFIELLKAERWQHSYGGRLHRKFTDTLLEEDMRDFVNSKYADCGLEDYDIEQIIAKMRNVGDATDYTSLLAAFTLYHDGFDYNFSDSTRQPFHFDYIDFENPGDNIFRAVNQFEVREGSEDRIPDVMLFVNGIPVGITSSNLRTQRTRALPFAKPTRR